MRPSQIITLLMAGIVSAFIGFQAYDRVTGASLPPPPPRQTAVVQRSNIAATVSATGSVVSQNSSQLTFRSSGRVIEVNVSPGSTVTKGQVLARLDPRDLQLQLDQARASLSSAQAKLDTIKDGARPEDIASARAQVSSAQAKLSDMISGGRPEDVASAQAAVDSAQAKLNLAMHPYTDAEIRAQESAVAQAQAALQKAQTDLYNLQHPDPTQVRNAEIELERSRNALNQVYINRDLTCGQKGKNSAECKAAHANAAASEASVKTAQSNLDNLKAGGKPQEIADAQAALQSAQAQLASAQQKLAEMQAGPKPEDLAQAQAALEQAKLQLALKSNPYTSQDIAQQQAAVVQAQQQLALKSEPYTARDLQTAQAAVDQAQASVSQAEMNLENSVLTAPFDGMVSTVGYSVGAMSSSGGTVGAPGITLIDTKNLRLDVNVDEVDVTKLAIGQQATVTFDALSGAQLSGQVTAISPAAQVNQGVVTYLASIVLAPGQSGYKVGMSGTASITVAQKNNVLVVPNRALRTVGRNRAVDVLDPATGKTETRNVRVGMANDQFTEIIEGLGEGEVVVIPSTTTAAPRTGGVGGPVGGPVIVTK